MGLVPVWVCGTCGSVAQSEPETASLIPTVRMGRCRNLNCPSRKPVKHKIKGVGETTHLGQATFFRSAHEG